VKQEQEPEKTNPAIFLTLKEVKDLIKKGEADFTDLRDIPGFEPPEIKEETEEAFNAAYQNRQGVKGNGQEK